MHDLSIGRQDQPERSEEHTSELQSRLHLVCRLLLEKKKDGLGRLANAKQRKAEQLDRFFVTGVVVNRLAKIRNRLTVFLFAIQSLAELAFQSAQYAVGVF